MYESVILIFIDPNPYFYLIKIRVRVTLSYIRNYPIISMLAFIVNLFLIGPEGFNEILITYFIHSKIEI